MMQAVRTFLRHAYGGGPEDLPLAVRSQLAVLEGWKGPFYNAPVFVQDDHRAPTRYTMRLGNRDYPHMKLRMELSPDGQQFLFRVDAHDRHVCPPPQSPEHAAFRSLMERNQQLVEAIETDWAAEGIPTFKTYLRDDLARRQQQQQAGQ
jgi:hypothetical protein